MRALHQAPACLLSGVQVQLADGLPPPSDPLPMVWGWQLVLLLCSWQTGHHTTAPEDSEELRTWQSRRADCMQHMFKIGVRSGWWVACLQRVCVMVGGDTIEQVQHADTSAGPVGHPTERAADPGLLADNLALDGRD